MIPQYYEPHNYLRKKASAGIERIKPYAVMFILTAFWVYTFTWAVDFGRHHCIKQGKYHVRKH